MVLNVGEPLESTILAAIEERLGESRFKLWFGDGVHLGLSGDGESLKVQVPNAFFRQWIQDHFSESLIEAVESITGRHVRLSFTTQQEVDCSSGNSLNKEYGLEQPQTQSTTDLAGHTDLASRTSMPQISHHVSATRRPRTLGNLVIGSGNRLAHAAAHEMIRTAGSLFNPLFIHGGVGLGKTGLLEATTHGLRSARPGLNLLWLTAEAFTNSFLESMRAGTLATFRSRYRGAGALAMDDIHFLAGTRATQSEFLHTFNTLLERGAPIILTADQHPRQISRLTEELVTRFLGGMVVKLEPPDWATRRAILQVASQSRGFTLPEQVLDYMAEHLRPSIRELEGALNTVIGHATLTGQRLDLALVKATLWDTIQHTRSAIGLREVEQAICRLFQIDVDALKSDSRARSIAYPRMVAMYLARKHTGSSYSTIGQYFGGRNHSTVMSAERKVKSWLHDEEQGGLLPGFESMASLLADLERSLGA